jgi:hypothetical protein
VAKGDHETWSQPCRHIVDLDHLISHERDTAHDEQHRTGILRDFEALVFHGVRTFLKQISTNWH